MFFMFFLTVFNLKQYNVFAWVLLCFGVVFRDDSMVERGNTTAKGLDDGLTEAYGVQHGGEVIAFRKSSH